MERNWKEIGDLSKMNSLDRLLDRIWFRDHNVPLFERKQARARSRWVDDGVHLRKVASWTLGTIAVLAGAVALMAYQPPLPTYARETRQRGEIVKRMPAQRDEPMGVRISEGNTYLVTGPATIEGVVSQGDTSLYWVVNPDSLNFQVGDSAEFYGKKATDFFTQHEYKGEDPNGRPVYENTPISVGIASSVE